MYKAWKMNKTTCLVSSPTKNICFYQYSQIPHVFKQSQQCTGLLPMYSLSNTLLTTYYLCKTNEFSMKNIKMWLTAISQGQGWTYHMTLSLHKNFIESTFKTAAMEHIHCILFYFFFPWMSIGWRLRFKILEGMTHHLEVEVTWEQHKTPWRSGLSRDEKESP